MLRHISHHGELADECSGDHFPLSRDDAAGVDHCLRHSADFVFRRAAIAKYTIIRQKEAELRRDLREIKDAIDRYKTRLTGTRSGWKLGAKAIRRLGNAGEGSAAWRKQRSEDSFSAEIPIDPMTGRANGTARRSGTIQIRRAGAARTCSTYTRSRQLRLSMERSIRIGSSNED